MNGILGMSDLFRDTPLDERQGRFVDMLHGSAELLLFIINDIPTFPRSRPASSSSSSFPFSPARAVEEVALLFAERAQLKGLELLVLVDPSVPSSVRGDPHRFRQVLGNLVSNAVKFTEAGRWWCGSNSRRRRRRPTPWAFACAARSKTPASAFPKAPRRISSRPSPRPTIRWRGAMAAPAWSRDRPATGRDDGRRLSFSSVPATAPASAPRSRPKCLPGPNS